jgi:hypothetical protein
MKKHIDVYHSALVKKLVEDPKIALVKALTLDWEASKKRVHVSPSIISRLFLTYSMFKKGDPTQVGFLDDLMLLLVKGF